MYKAKIFQSNLSLKRKVNMIRASLHQAHNICSLEIFLRIKSDQVIIKQKLYLQKKVNKAVYLHLKKMCKKY